MLPGITSVAKVNKDNFFVCLLIGESLQYFISRLIVSWARSCQVKWRCQEVDRSHCRAASGNLLERVI